MDGAMRAFRCKCKRYSPHGPAHLLRCHIRGGEVCSTSETIGHRPYDIGECGWARSEVVARVHKIHHFAPACKDGEGGSFWLPLPREHPPLLCLLELLDLGIYCPGSNPQPGWSLDRPFPIALVDLRLHYH